MMAYRCTEHETTGMSPNMLMLGRETSTPLDICFEMPPSIKSQSTNNWVWELRERLELAHTFVRQNTGLSIYRQKQYHDRKISFEKLEVDDKVYVLFPVKQSGQSSKLCSFWRGPFQIKEKLCEVLYVVNCGRNGTHQVIHVNRLKLARSQLLSGEVEINDSTENEKSAEIEMPNDLINTEEKEIEIVTEDFSRFGRQRQKPVWLKDYVSSLCRKKMPPLKTTPRKDIRPLCHYCKEHIGPEESFGTHMEICYNKRFQCDSCGKNFKEKAYLKQHQKRKHSVVKNH